jgi:hypothetical protein
MITRAALAGFVGPIMCSFYLKKLCAAFHVGGEGWGGHRNIIFQRAWDLVLADWLSHSRFPVNM